MGSVGGGGGGLISSPDLGDGISVADALGVERVRLGRISGTDYGLKVVSSDGATVIIDGSSNMFKIAASGTLSVTIADQSAGNSTVDVTALRPQSTSLALLAMIGTVNSASDVRRGAFFADGQAFTRFVAATSGGAVTTRAIVLQHYYYAASSLVGGSSDTPRVTLSGVNETGASKTAYLRYYLLQETAI